MEDKKNNKSLQEIKKELQGQVLNEADALFIKGGRTVETDRQKTAAGSVFTPQWLHHDLIFSKLVEIDL